MGSRKLKFGEFFRGLDIFGHPIGVHYRGSDKYQTHLGACCTILAYVIMAFNCYTMTVEFWDHSRQEQTTEVLVSDIYDSPSYYFG